MAERSTYIHTTERLSLAQLEARLKEAQEALAKARTALAGIEVSGQNVCSISVMGYSFAVLRTNDRHYVSEIVPGRQGLQVELRKLLQDNVLHRASVEEGIRFQILQRMKEMARA